MKTLNIFYLILLSINLAFAFIDWNESAMMGWSCAVLLLAKEVINDIINKL